MPPAILTPRAVQRLAAHPGQKGSLYLDQHPDAPRGFALRVTAAGARSFYVLVRLRGRRRWIRLGDARALSLDDARRAARARVGAVALGRDPTAEARAEAAAERAARLREAVEAGEWTVVDLLEAYRQARLSRLSPVTAAEYARSIVHDVEPATLGSMRAREVVRDDVRSFVAKVAKRAPVVAWRLLVFLRSAYRWAQDEEALVVGPAGERLVRTRVDRDPTRRLEHDLHLPSRARRERHLSDAEIVIFWRGLESLKLAWSTFARLILLCGTRRGETYAARWEDVDLEACRWHIPAANRKGRVAGSYGARRALDVPLSPLAVQLLRELHAVTGGRERVFRAQGFSIGLVGSEVRRATGLEDLSIHDLRRSCSSGLQRLGAPPHVISVVLGHAREAGATLVDAAYMHGGREGEHRLWLERFSAHVERLVSGRPADVVAFPGAG